MLLAGFNPWAVDVAATRLMGLDPRLIPMLNAPLQRIPGFDWPLPEDGRPEMPAASRVDVSSRVYKPHFGWRILDPTRD